MKISRIILLILLATLMSNHAYSQGSIFGSVDNADLSSPANGEIVFVGYLDDTDEEIRIESCVGAGYDNGNWFDDFQNYLTEGAGNPYDYHFFNIANNESVVLSDLIPANSFQQENIQLTSSSFPHAPATIQGAVQTDSTVKISWECNALYTYRIYRRPAVSDGSFYRIDNISGNLSDYGLADSVYYDSTTDNASDYDYLVIPIDNGAFGVHSEIITVSSIPAQDFICGDIDQSGLINLLDITYLIRYMYQGDSPPAVMQSADVNNSHSINLLDCTYLITYIYSGGPAPNCPDTWEE